MRKKNHLYKKVLDSAPFGTLLFAYGVCIDANAKSLSLLGCQRSELLGLSLNEATDNQPDSLIQLKKVHAKIDSDQLSGLLWRTQGTLETDELVVSVGALEESEDVLCIMLYPLPALAHMVVEEFNSADFPVINTATIEPTDVAVISNAKSLASNPKSTANSSVDIDGLPIAQTLLQSIDDYLELSANGPNLGALLLIDLDHFNSINESLGKHIGSQILERAGESVQGMLSDMMQMEQVAGDSFLLFIKDLATSPEQAQKQAMALANEIRCSISRPFFTENGEVIVTASVGISLLYQGSDEASLTASKAIQQAESAMFEAKRRGRDTQLLFDTQITHQAQQRISLQSSLRKAVVNQEFDLYLQPQVSTHDGSVVGGEVLLRWIHSGHAMHTPAEFIPILEASGMIVDVGLWVIRTACEYLRNMLDRGIWTPDMQLGVNISPKQFHDPGLITSLEHSLKSYDISADMITLEVTENLLIDDFESVVDKMKKIRDMGTKFAIDDFGSGYSSMIYLKRLPLDSLKIDREFIANLNADKDTLGLVEAIMMVSRHYGLDVVAEGVEKREILEVLRSLGCDKYQGAHFSMPVSLDKFQRLLVA